MQTTLLGIAISLILALLAALVGPLFIDWRSYRSELEAQARILTGLEVRVTGTIDARLLPTPSLMLRGIELGRPNEAGKLWARALRIEFALGSLMRGEWRITDAELEGPEFTAELDETGHLAIPIQRVEFKPEAVAIERLRVTDGRAVLSDVASGSRLILDELDFRGELRSLAGPIKGEGSVLMAGQRYPYRITTSRIAEDSSVRVRLAVNLIHRPLTAEADLSIVIENGMPRFEGSLQFARPAGRAPAGARPLIIEPWRLTGRIKGNASAAQLEQIEFQYGPDERATKLRGSASVTFGQEPQAVANLSSPQIDFDRLLGLPETTRGRPTAALKALAEGFAGTLRLPIAATLTVGVDALTLGGATLQRVATEVKGQDDNLDIRWLEFRGPGATQVRLDGGVGQNLAGINFQGSAKVASNDPRALLAWLADRSDMPNLSGPMRLEGEVAFTPDGIAIDKLDFEIDRMMLAGRLQYGWASDHRPARLDAALNSPAIDLDRAHAIAKAVLGDAAVDWPREGTLSLGIERVSVAGVEAKQADVIMRIDPNGIDLERLAIVQLDGATAMVTGRLAAKAGAPHGAVTIDVEAGALDGVLALVEKFAPKAADRFRQVAGRLTPVRMRGSLALAARSTTNAETNARFEVGGHAGALRVALRGDVSVAGDAKIENLAALAAAKVDISGQLDADDGRTLAELIAINHLIAVENRPGRLSFSAIGPLDGQLAMEARYTAGALDFTSNGTIRLPAAGGSKAGMKAGPTIGGALRLSNANILSPRPAAGQQAEQLPSSIEARLSVSDRMVRLIDVKGTIAGTSIGGQLAIDLKHQPTKIDGDIELGAVDLPAALAALTGIPVSAGAKGRAPAHPGGRATEMPVGATVGYWPAEPFEESALHRLAGQIAMKSARVTLTPKLTAQQVRAVLHLGPTEFGLQGLDGNLAGGKVNAEMMFFHRDEGIGARGRVNVSAANAAELLPGEGLLSGRLTLDAALEGAGRSPVALIGSLNGSGSYKLENGSVARLDPAAFPAIIRAVDRGLPIDASKVGERMELALAAGGLAIPLADGMIKVSSGQARLSATSVQAQGADLAVSGSVDMAQAAIDARLSMTGPAGASSAPRPEVMMSFKGPVDAPKRSIDVAVLASWLALRAVDQQSKKLDVLEGREPPTPAIEAPVATEPVAPVEPRAVGIEQEPARPRPVPRSAPKPKSPAAEPAPALQAPAEPKAVGIEPEPARPRPVPRSAPKPKSPAAEPAPALQAPAEPKAVGIEPEPARPSPLPRSAPKPRSPAAEPAPALPPPIDIRPVPSPRPPRAAGPQSGQSPSPQTGQSPSPQTGQSPPPKAATPARPRSLSEILFGN